jgi:hypothetical protein
VEAPGSVNQRGGAATGANTGRHEDAIALDEVSAEPAREKSALARTTDNRTTRGGHEYSVC